MVEDVLVEMKRIVETNLALHLGKQDGKYEDGIVLSMPKTIQLGIRTIPIDGLPAIQMAPDYAGDFHYATQKKDVTYTINIGVVVEDSVEDNAERKLWRTLRALENCLEINLRNGSSPIMDFKTVGISYDTGPYGIENENSLVKAGILSCEVKERVNSYIETQV